MSFTLEQAIDYYREHNFDGDQAMAISGIPGAVGLTRNLCGEIVPLLHPPLEWKVATSEGAGTMMGFSLGINDQSGLFEEVVVER